VEEIVKCVGDLPAMPQTASEVLNLSEDPNAGVHEVSGALEKDPSLTIKVLKIVNSAYYGMSRNVGSLQLACVILGFREIRNIVLGVAAFDSLTDEKALKIISEDFWAHSFSVAGVAKALGARVGVNQQGAEFSAGLLHDVGKLVLARQVGDAYAGVYAKSQGRGDALCDLEREALGCTHAHVAAALMKAWKLPNSLIGAVLLHHAGGSVSLDAAPDPELAAVVRIADGACRAAERIEAGDDGQGPAEAVARDREAWRVLSHTPNPIAPAERGQLVALFVEEIASQTPPLF
jgi:HD-like signal output (HDOD) protein